MTLSVKYSNTLAALLLGAFLFLGNACKTSRATTGNDLRELTPEGLLATLRNNRINAKWLEAKAKISFDDGEQQISVAATVKMRKDSVLWASIKKLGFEVARVKVTPDSVYVLDRINNEYAVRDLKFIEQQFNAPADLQTLQALLLGNPVFFSNTMMKAELQEPFYHLFGESDVQENHYWLQKSDKQLSKMDIKDKRNQRNMTLLLQEYTPIAGGRQNFAYLRNMEMDSRETGKVAVEVHFSEVALDKPVDMTFEIPDRYTRVK